jgi:NDP-sugar pyrophosphorylase family protein
MCEPTDKRASGPAGGAIEFLVGEGNVVVVVEVEGTAKILGATVIVISCSIGALNKRGPDTEIDTTTYIVTASGFAGTVKFWSQFPSEIFEELSKSAAYEVTL